MFQHINAMINRESFFDRLKQILAPGDWAALLRRLARRQARYNKRSNNHSRYGYDGDRQRARYARQGAEQLQRNSHKPGTLQLRHIFGCS